jgi:PBP1b-binding outer membrane lipoprotein LpoB
MRHQILLSIASAVLLFGCSSEPEVNISIAPETPALIKSTVEQAWPKIKATCPGLQKYWSDLQFAGIEDNLSFAPENAKRIEIKFSVSESPERIPSSYRAAGHTCFFSVSPDGKKLGISKSPCEPPRLSWRPVGLSQATTMEV